MTEIPPLSTVRDRLTGGAVLACIGDRASGRSVTRIAEVLARGLGARVLLATVQQPGLIRRGLEQATGVRVTVGEPSERLLELAERERAQLIVVAAPRESTARTPLLGNVHLALAGAASCPVVIVPPGVSAIPTDGPIVCGVDGSASSRAAAELAADLARRLDSHLLVVESISAPPDRLIAVAERECAQVVVTASRGRGTTASMLVGPIASRLVLDAARPVLVVPERTSSASSSSRSMVSRSSRI